MMMSKVGCIDKTSLVEMYDFVMCKRIVDDKCVQR